MKIKSITVIAALLVTGSLQACCSDCTAAMTTTQPGIFLASATTTGFEGHRCSNIWSSAEGTCCDKAKLDAFATAWKTSLEAKKAQIKTQIASMDFDVIKTQVGIIAGMITMNAFPPNTGVVSAELKAKVIGALTALNVYFLKPVDTSAILESCTEAYIKFREEATCHRCAGKASEWWDAAAKKYKVNHASCNKIVELCAPALAITGAATNVLLKVREMYKIMFPSLLNGLSPDGDIGATDSIDPANIAKL